jgi:hypothetical protein
VLPPPSRPARERFDKLFVLKDLALQEVGGMAKKNKKTKTSKLPKTIAGVKVPKELRDAGAMLAKLARDPAAREVALAAITAALAARKDSRNAARKTLTGTGEIAGKAGRAAGWMGPALTAAAVEAGRLLLEAYDKGGVRGGTISDDGEQVEKGRKEEKALPADGELAQGVTH